MLKGAYEKGWLHAVFTAPDVKAAHKYLLVHGMDVKADRDPRGGITHLSLHDPEGNETGSRRLIE